MSPLLIRVLAAVLLNGLAAVGAYIRGSVTLSGGLTGFLLGSVLFVFGTPWAFAMLMAFFISSSVLGRFARPFESDLRRMHRRGSRRDAVQVLANVGLPAALSIPAFVAPGPIFGFGIAVSFAVANADTWASEIGVTAENPRLITSGKEVERGRSGGVSLRGYIAAAGGALLLAIIHVLARAAGGGETSKIATEAILVVIFGLFGCTIDSLLGASVQAHYLDRATGTYTERPGGAEGPNTLVHGLRIMTNDAVNALSILLSVALALAGWWMLFSD